MRLAGTAALVTGASSGIGRASARLLAAEGAAVALAARRVDRLEELARDIDEQGGTAVVIEADVAEREAAEATLQRAVGELGRLDVLVNNAGVMLLGPIADAPLEEWERMVGVNLLGSSTAPGRRCPTCSRRPSASHAGPPIWSTSPRSPAVWSGRGAACTTRPSTRSAPSANRYARR
jgi:NADP-dependent 3-hydroxy acid dehydrogenase YdfG